MMGLKLLPAMQPGRTKCGLRCQLRARTKRQAQEFTALAGAAKTPEELKTKLETPAGRIAASETELSGDSVVECAFLRRQRAQ